MEKITSITVEDVKTVIDKSKDLTEDSPMSFKTNTGRNNIISLHTMPSPMTKTAQLSIIEKSRIVNTNEMKSVGNSWFIASLFSRILNENYRFIEYISMIPALYVILAIRLISALVLFAVGIVLFVKTNNGYTAYIVLTIFEALQTALLSIICKSIYESFEVGFERPLTFSLFLCMILLNAIVCPLIPYVIETSLSIIIDIVLIAFACINLVYELNMVLWLILLPIFIIIGLTEYLIRLFKCNLECPTKVKITLECTYKLYPYVESDFSEKICAICRDVFNPTQHVCKLQCNSSHIFHEECIFTALISQTSCPICRRPASFA